MAAMVTSPPSRRSISISEMRDLEYAGFWRRALASLLDNTVWIFFFLLWFNYFAFCEWRWGQTIGKNATGLEVRSVDGSEKLTYGQASIRNLLRLIDFFLIGELMIAGSRRKQRLGDRAAKTVVVIRARRTAPAQIRGA